MKFFTLIPLLLVGQLIGFSQSNACGAPFQQSASQKVEFVVYDLSYKKAGEIEKLLRPLFSIEEDYRLFSDPIDNRIYLSGSPETHRIASQLINQVDRSSPPQIFSGPQRAGQTGPQSPRIEPSKPNSFNRGTDLPIGQSFKSQLSVVNRARNERVEAGSKGKTGSTVTGELKNAEDSGDYGASITRFVLIAADNLKTVEKQIVGIFKQKLNLVRKENREILVIILPAKGIKIEVEFDQQRNGVLIGGPARIVDQMATLCQALASSHEVQNQQTRVFRVQKTNQMQVRDLIRSPPAKANKGPTEKDRRDNRSQSIPERSSDQGANQFQAARILPAAFVFQEDLPAEENSRNAAQPTGPATTPAQEQAIRQFEGVEIETMPDLDVIILRGREQDLKQLEEIIRQIERISRETQPVIRIYQLRNTQSAALAEIITESQDDLIGGRQGRISITPLAKPNALLMIGWGEAVTAVIDLIRQLDVPVHAQTQFQVFRIKHASAAAINGSLQTFFSSRGNLGPEVTGVVDERTNSIIVYAAPRDMLEVARMISELDVANGVAVNRTQIIPIRNSLAADVAQTLESAIEAASSNTRAAIMELMAFNEKGQQILRSGTLNEVQITPNLRNNTLIVTSPLENFDLLQELIRQLDTPASRSQLKIFKIYNSDAGNLVQTLRSLIPGSSTAAGNIKLPTVPDEISLTPLRFSIDVRSNSILATGSEGDLRIAEALIAKLDESTSSQRKTEVYPLKNSPAVDVANAINQFLQSSRQVENAAPGAQNPFQELEREVIVVPEPIANKLLVSATSRYFEEISQLIEKLDEQPPQVMIQVLIAEIDLNDTDEFGIEVGLQDSVLFDRGLLSDLLTTTSTTTTSDAAGIVTELNEIIQAADILPGFNFNTTRPLGNSASERALRSPSTVGAQGISNFSVGRTSNQADFGGLVLSASSQNVSLLLRAMQESRRVDILSRPQVRTLDNQPAFIQVGERVPRIIGSTVNQNGQSNSVTLENIGLILAVTPRISPDGTVVMEIDAEKSDLGTELDGIPVAVSTDGTIIRSPRVDTTTAQATVSAVDGETIVLGGLITKKTEQVSRSVPYLNQIPLLKNFFKYDGVSSRRTELLIILTPRVIRNEKDNARIRQIETARMNWCAADVFELHGEVDAIEDVSTDQLDEAEPQVIYPVENPRGEILKSISTGSAATTPLLPKRFRRGGIFRGFLKEKKINDPPPTTVPTPVASQSKINPVLQNLPE